MMFLENNASRTRHAVNEDCYEIESGVSVYVSYQHDENRIRVSAYGRATEIPDGLIGPYDYRKADHKCWVFETW